jgi:hypothetical protein
MDSHISINRIVIKCEGTLSRAFNDEVLHTAHKLLICFKPFEARGIGIRMSTEVERVVSVSDVDAGGIANTHLSVLLVHCECHDVLGLGYCET